MRDLSANPTASATRLSSVPLGDIVARLVDPPSEIARLSADQYLRGQVVGQDEAGLLLVQTRLALVKLAVARTLAVGSDVILQLRAGGPSAGVTLIPLDPVAQAPAAVQAGSPAPQVAEGDAVAARSHPGAATAPSADLINKAPLLRAVLQSAPPLPLLAGLPSAEPGTELLVRILAVGTPQAMATISGQPAAAGPQSSRQAASANAGTAPPGAASGGQPATGGAEEAKPVPTRPAPTGLNPTGPNPTGPNPPGLKPTGLNTAGVVRESVGQPAATTTPPRNPPGPLPGMPSTGSDTEPGLRLAPQATVISAGRGVTTAMQGLTVERAAQAVGSNGAATPGSAGAGGEDQFQGDGRALRLTGMVTVKTKGGPTIIHSPLGSLTLKAPVELPAGSSLALEVLLPGHGRTAGAPGPLAPSWTGLEGLEDSLLAQLSGAQAEALQRALPQVGPRLSSGLLFFLSAINQGSPLAWLASPAAALDRSERGEFLDRLGRDLAGLSRSVETGSGEWRLLQLPVWSDQGLRGLRLFLRQQDGHGSQGDDGKKDKATRFVLELDLKRHGELQLDGLVSGRKFDLILRSRRQFSPVQRSDLTALFEEANAIGGYHGRLIFQPTQNWTRLQSAPSEQAETVLRV